MTNCRKRPGIESLPQNRPYFNLSFFSFHVLCASNNIASNVATSSIQGCSTGPPNKKAKPKAKGSSSKLQIQAMHLAGIVHLINVFNSPDGFTRQVTAHDMEYTIRCMEYFEKTSLAVYDCICGSSAPLSWGKITQEQAIREFSKHVKITNQAWFAKGIGKAPTIVSRALNSKDKP